MMTDIDIHNIHRIETYGYDFLHIHLLRIITVSYSSYLVHCWCNFTLSENNRIIPDKIHFRSPYGQVTQVSGETYEIIGKKLAKM